VSQENIEVVHRLMEEFGARTASDDSAAAFVAEFFDPRADYYPVRKFPDARPRHGGDEIAAFFASYAETWGEYEFVVVRIASAGEDRVAVHGAIKAQGRGAELRLEGDIYHSVWLRHGRVLRWEDHLTERGALDGLGLTDRSLADLQRGDSVTS
jgi:SnoaL-like protein